MRNTTKRLRESKLIQKIILIFVSALLFYSCTSENQVRQTDYPNLYDGKYDSEFPYRNSSEQLEEISNTISLVNSIAFYRTYHFEINDSITINAIRRNEHKKFLEKSTTFEETASGTGTFIYNSGKTVAVLTCSHIINFPDSVKTFYMSTDGINSGLLKNFSEIVKRDIYIVPFFEEGNFEIVVQDEELDIAILKKDIKSQPNFRFRTFDFPLGKANELRWGTFVYVFGFPANYKMISKGIVSNPNYDKKSSFIIDAVANQGLSGGIVLAIRDGVPNFELVGMVLTAPAEYEYVLRPKKDDVVLLGSEYIGPVITGARKHIKYGITKVLAIESIMKFIENNSKILLENNIDIDQIFQ